MQQETETIFINCLELEENFMTTDCKSFSAVLLTLLTLVDSPYLLFAQSSNAVGLQEPKLKANAALWRYNPPGETLSDQLLRAHVVADQQRIEWRGLDVIVSSGLENLEDVGISSLTAQLRKETCSADTIVVGRVNNSVYHLSDSKTSIYGDHLFTVNQVLKSNVLSPFKVLDNIVITRPGGSISLPEGPVNVRYDDFPVFERGATYLLFLRYRSESSSYDAAESFSALKAEGDTWRVLAKDYSRLTSSELKHSAIEQLVSSSLRSCR